MASIFSEIIHVILITHSKTIYSQQFQNGFINYEALLYELLLPHAYHGAITKKGFLLKKRSQLCTKGDRAVHKVVRLCGNGLAVIL
jgi:hypothetical protein